MKKLKELLARMEDASESVTVEDSNEGAGYSVVVSDEEVDYSLYIQDNEIRSIMELENIYDNQGFLYDIDDNGIDELILLYTYWETDLKILETEIAERYTVSPTVFVNVYTINDGEVCLLNELSMYEHFWGIDGHVAIVEKDNKTYLARYRIYGEDDNSRVEDCYIEWTLYEFSDGSFVEIEDIRCDYKVDRDSDNNITTREGSAQVAGEAFTYDEFVAYLDTYSYCRKADTFVDDSGISFVDLYQQLSGEDVLASLDTIDKKLYLFINNQEYLDYIDDIDDATIGNLYNSYTKLDFNQDGMEEVIIKYRGDTTGEIYKVAIFSYDKENDGIIYNGSITSGETALAYYPQRNEISVHAIVLDQASIIYEFYELKNNKITKKYELIRELGEAFMEFTYFKEGINITEEEFDEIRDGNESLIWTNIHFKTISYS